MNIVNDPNITNSTTEEKITKRFSLEIPLELNDYLTKNIPWGNKNNTIICLLAKLSDHMEESAGYEGVIIDDILNNRFSISTQTVEKIKDIKN